MIDAHCHLDQYPNPQAVARAAEKLGITIIAMTGLPSHYAAGRAHATLLPRTRLALGLHPLLAEHHQAELKLFETHLETTSYIGEVGLDFSRHGRATRQTQLDSFRRVLELLRGQPKFISLHSRGAERDVLELLREFETKQAVLHWFSGPVNVAEDAALAGHYFSVNPAMVRSRSGQALLERIPPHLILTETDGPYVQINGRAATPQDIPGVIKSLADLWSIDEDVARIRIQSNFRSALADIVASKSRRIKE